MSMSGGQGVSEAVASGSSMEGALKDGLRLLSEDQTVNFILYKRVVLPYDGFVFWVRAEILSPGALIGGSPLNSFQLNQGPVVGVPAAEFSAKGSLHHTTTSNQNKDTSYANNRLIFTSEQKINDLNDLDPGYLYIGVANGLRFAFSSRSLFYRQSNLYHYSGNAVYSTMSSQIIDFPDQLNDRDIVVSNSLPLWLNLATSFPLYPSYLVPDNTEPSYGAVHIGDEDTDHLTLGPIYDATGGSWQLARDRVRITTFGVRSNDIIKWIADVVQYSLNNPFTMGVMNTPVARDAKHGQVEISALAQQKEIRFDVSYYQIRVEEVARTLIRRSFLEDFFVPGITPSPPFLLDSFGRQILDSDGRPILAS